MWKRGSEASDIAFSSGPSFQETLAPWKRTAISKRRKKESGGGFYAMSSVGQHSLKCITVRERRAVCWALNGPLDETGGPANDPFRNRPVIVFVH